MEFDQIYTSFQPKIYRYVVKIVGNQEAEDLTQEIFAKVHNSLKSFRNESQLSTWIYRIATNAAIDIMRNPSFQQKMKMEQKTPKLLDMDVDELQSLCFTEKALSLEEQVVHKEMNMCIQGIVQRLPESYRMVVILSELEGLKNKEIAEILDISLEMVKIRLHRGRAKLKREFQNHCNFSWDERNELFCDPKTSNEIISNKR